MSAGRKQRTYRIREGQCKLHREERDEVNNYHDSIYILSFNKEGTANFSLTRPQRDTSQSNWGRCNAEINQLFFPCRHPFKKVPL